MGEKPSVLANSSRGGERDDSSRDVVRPRGGEAAFDQEDLVGGPGFRLRHAALGKRFEPATERGRAEILDASDGQVGVKGAVFGGVAPGASVLGNRLLDMGEPVDFAAQADPNHSGLSMVREAAGPIEFELEGRAVAGGGFDGGGDGGKIGNQDIAEEPEREVELAGGDPSNGRAREMAAPLFPGLSESGLDCRIEGQGDEAPGQERRRIGSGRRGRSVRIHGEVDSGQWIRAQAGRLRASRNGSF